jgi:hypothetical protein
VCSEAEDLAKFASPLRPVLLRMYSVAGSNFPAIALEFKPLLEMLCLVIQRCRHFTVPAQLLAFLQVRVCFLWCCRRW